MEGAQSATVNLKDMQWKMDKMMMDRIDPIIAALQEYLCDNITNFSLYNCRKCPCVKDNNGVSYKRKSPFIFNAYKGRRYNWNNNSNYNRFRTDDEDCDNCNDCVPSIMTQ